MVIHTCCCISVPHHQLPRHGAPSRGPVSKPEPVGGVGRRARRSGGDPSEQSSLVCSLWARAILGAHAFICICASAQGAVRASFCCWLVCAGCRGRKWLHVRYLRVSFAIHHPLVCPSTSKAGPPKAIGAALHGVWEATARRAMSSPLKMAWCRGFNVWVEWPRFLSPRQGPPAPASPETKMSARRGGSQG